MKKGLIFALVAVLAVAFAIPAFAFHVEGAKDSKFYFGGIALTDIGVWNRSKEFAGGWGGNSDRTEFILSVPRHSRLRASVEQGSVGAFFELGMGRDLIAAHEQGDAGSAADKFGRNNYIETRKIYGWYKFGNCSIIAGKTDGSIWVAHPYQNLGFEHNNHVVGLGWGSVYDDRAAQVRFTQDFSKAFGWQISLIQPYVTDVNVPAPTAANPAATRNVDSYAQFPRVDVMFKMNFGPVSLMPGGSWQSVKFDNLPSGYDDSVQYWYVQLPVKVKAGAFAFTGQVGYGQNLIVFPLQNSFHNYGRDAGGKVKNTTGLTAFADVAFTAGPVTPHFYIGYDKAENTDVYVGDKYNTRMMYGVGVNWKIADNFYIVPEFTYYDYGKNARAAGNPDLGNEWLGGVQFQFVF